jgi:hypothetical protein
MAYDLDTPLRFGKHKGRTVEDVMAEDPYYLFWCLENVESFEVDDALQDAITRAAKSRR